MAVSQYCTQADMERRFSVAGVQAFSDHDQTGAADTDVLDDCIDEASEEIERFCWPYSNASLATSRTINRWCTDLAIFHLCNSRGNPAPESFAAKVEYIRGQLQLIHDRKQRLSGIAEKGNNLPSVSNVVPDRGDPTGPVRVDQYTSPPAPGVLAPKQLRAWR